MKPKSKSMAAMEPKAVMKPKSMEVVWCHICGRNRKASHHDDFVCCDVCKSIAAMKPKSMEVVKPKSMEVVVWCHICRRNRKASHHDDFVCCDVCGLVFGGYDDFFPQHRPEPGPQQQHPVRVCADKLGISDRYIIEDAIKCFGKAFSYFGFRRVVEVVCLYMGCCFNGFRIMLLELSLNEHVSVSVYYLGLLFLDVCEFLSVEIDGFRPPQTDDPLFFIHRFMFFEENNNKDVSVLFTALRILAAMRMDCGEGWLRILDAIKIEYGGGGWKRLGGLLAAAVYMAGGFDSSDVDDVVPAVPSPNLEVVEFDCLAREFRSVAEEYEDSHCTLECIMGNVEDLCPHNNVDKFCGGFCSACYDRFLKLSIYFSEYFSEGSDLGNNGFTVPRQDNVQALCTDKSLTSVINFDALRQVFGDDDVVESTNTQSQEANGTSYAMEQGRAREENWGVGLANSGDALGREGSACKDDQREEVLVNKVRGRFGQPKRRRLGLQT